MQVREWIFGRALVVMHMQSGGANCRWVEVEEGWNSVSVLGQGNDPSQRHRVVAEQPPGRGGVPTSLLTRLWQIFEVEQAFPPYWK